MSLNHPNRFPNYTLYQFPSSKLENSKDSVFVLERQDDQLIYRYANQAGLNFLNIKCVEEKTIDDLFPPFEAAFLKKYYHMTTSSNQRITFKGFNRNHHFIGVYETELTPIKHSDCQYILTVIRSLSTNFVQRTNPVKFDDATTISEQKLSAEYQLDYDGYFLKANSEVEAIIGYLPFELVGTNFTQYLPLNELFKVKQYFQQVLAGHSIQFKTKLMHKNKKLATYEITLRPVIKNGKIKSVSGIIEKIQKRETITS